MKLKGFWFFALAFAAFLATGVAWAGDIVIKVSK
jgi:hypothetical protein